MMICMCTNAPAEEGHEGQQLCRARVHVQGSLGVEHVVVNRSCCSTVTPEIWVPLLDVCALTPVLAAQVQEPATTGGAAIESAGPEVAPAPSPAAVQQQTILHSVNAYGANSTVRQETYGATQISSYAQVGVLSLLCSTSVLGLRPCSCLMALASVCVPGVQHSQVCRVQHLSL